MTSTTAHRTRTRTRVAALALGGALSVAGVAGVAAAPSASAAGGQVGQRETVCAQDLAVRTEKLGAWMGALRQGQTFDVERVDGEWAYGFAYGDINRRGWVQQGWFC